MSDSWDNIEDAYNAMYTALGKLRNAEIGVRWEDGKDSQKILTATRHAKSQLEPIVEFLGRKLEE